MARVPEVPQLRLPRADKPFLGGTAVSVGAHAFLIFAVVWGTAQASEEYLGSFGGPGPEGGGGGGGGSEIRYLQVLPFVAAAPARAALPEERAVQLPIPEPELRAIPPETRRVSIVEPTGPVVPVARIGVGPGTGGDDGSGTGTGGGVGTGRGTGIGSAEGPGTGGEGGFAFAPRSRQMLLPPDAPQAIKGREFRVRFYIDARGRVTDVEVEPRIENRGYRKKFLEKMRQFTFHPARTADGSPVAAYYDVIITP
jgi:hypothetical protein